MQIGAALTLVNKELTFLCEMDLSPVRFVPPVDSGGVLFLPREAKPEGILIEFDGGMNVLNGEHRPGREDFHVEVGTI